ncbi:MAG: 16S rRNA (uracil(1498)-N(3))-methyltransferase [Lachnospiraceae bacterium]|nr:16S rRNA (uracil(1498)-N(3))-methyltransferase [Lachnospiraceae bacterium]
MYHFFVEDENVFEGHIDITGNDYNHLKNVLRIRVGEELLISSKAGDNYMCKVSELKEDAVECEILSKTDYDYELPSKIYLFQGLPKSDKMEMIIQKAVELGAYEIIPVATKRSIVKLDAKKETSKISRWQAISESAAKQSKRSIIPNVSSVMSFKEAIKYAVSMDIKIIPYENAKGMQGTREFFMNIEKGKSIAIFIGPEGGFDESEIELAMESGIQPVTLGKRILRTETAGLATLSMLVFVLEEN